MSQKVFFKDIKKHILSYISSANKSIKIAVAWFTDKEIISNLLLKANQNVKVEIIVYKDKKLDLKIFHDLALSKNVEIRFHDSMMHNKFCIIDDFHLINGSYNWTYKARTNEENITITTDNKELISLFNQQYIELKSNSKLHNDLFQVKSSISSLKEYKNSFNKFYKQINEKYTGLKYPQLYFRKDAVENPYNKSNLIKKGVYLFESEQNRKYFFLYLFCCENKIFFDSLEKLFDDIVRWDFETYRFEDVFNIGNFNFDNSIISINKKELAVQKKALIFNDLSHYTNDSDIHGYCCIGFLS